MRGMADATDPPGSTRATFAMPVEPVVMRVDRPVAPWLFRAWELLAPRAPQWGLRWTARFFLRFPPGSRPRRWFLVGMSVIVWDAIARGRYDLVLPIWDPNGVWHWDATFRTVGLDEVYRGPEGIRRSLGEINDVFTDRSFTVEEILDGGEMLIMRMKVSGRGVQSGVPGEGRMSAVARLDPLLIDYYNFVDDAEALRDAGFVLPRQMNASRQRRSD